MKARKIDHICIAVRDLDKARKVYEETLGLELAVEIDEHLSKRHLANHFDPAHVEIIHRLTLRAVFTA